MKYAREIPVKCPLTEKFLRMAPKFRWLSGLLLKFNANLPRWMAQNEMEIDPEDYIFIGFMTTLFFFLMGALSFAIYTILVGGDLYKSLPLILGVGFLPSFFVWMNFITYPRRIAVRRGKEVERALSYGIRELIIEVKSGIPLYNAIRNIAFGSYGGLSEEFQRVIRDVEMGVPLPEALENSALRVESKFYRNMIWAMISCLRAGTDVSEALSEILKALEEEQKLALKRYAQSLNPIILMYMMSSVIFPILLITLFIVMGSMSGLVFTKNHLYIIWFVVVSANIFFIVMVRAKRPAVIG